MLATWGCTTFPKPTLSLDFLGATSLDSGITFSRGSQATLFDSTGTLRYAKHNLALQSQTFQTTWIVSNSSVSTDATVAPDGTSTADKLIENTANAVHQIDQTVTVLSSGTYAASFYIKADTRTKARVAFITGGTGGVFADADLIAGTIGAATAFGGGIAISSAIHNMGNGWFRCIVTGIGPASTSGQLRIELLDAAGNRTYTGDGTSGLFLWGAQLNLANMEGGVTSSLSTYYPTTTAAYYAPRFDYNPSTLQPRGLLIEEQRTNSIRNNTGQGAVAGTPGTLPTDWFSNTVLTGLTFSVVGTGSESGITYIDLRINGTPSGAGNYDVGFVANTQVAALTAQTWTESLYYKIAAGSSAGLSTVNVRFNEFTSGGAFISGQTSANLSIPTTAALSTQRVSATATLSGGATTAFIQPFLRLGLSGVAIDITLRIGLPQLELGAFATSVIPTTTTALTRNADVASMTGTNFSSWYSASEGTIYTQAIGVNNFAAASRRFVEVDDGTANERIFLGYNSSTSSTRYLVTDGGVTQSDVNVSSITAGALVKMAAAYKVNDFQQASNGALGTADTSGTLPTVDRMFIGQAETTAAASMLNGWVQRIAFYPQRLPNATLQALTS